MPRLPPVWSAAFVRVALCAEEKVLGIGGEVVERIHFGGGHITRHQHRLLIRLAIFADDLARQVDFVEISLVELTALAAFLALWFSVVAMFFTTRSMRAAFERMGHWINRATGLVFIVWRWRLSLPVRAAVLAAATLVAAPVAIFYDLMLGTIAACWLVRDQSQPISPAEKTFFAAIVLLLLDVRDLGEAYHVPVAAIAALGLLVIAASRAFRELAQQDPAWAARWWGKRFAT